MSSRERAAADVLRSSLPRTFSACRITLRHRRLLLGQPLRLRRLLQAEILPPPPLPLMHQPPHSAATRLWATLAL